MESHATAASDNPEAARSTSQALLSSERAWIEIEIGPPEKDYEPDEEGNILDLFECSIQIENHCRTMARIESVKIGVDSVDGPLPPEPLNSRTKNLHTVLGSRQKQTVDGFTADSFSDAQSILEGTKRGILRVVVKYRDVFEPSVLRETSAVYVFQNSLEDEPERVSSLCAYT